MYGWSDVEMMQLKLKDFLSLESIRVAKELLSSQLEKFYRHSDLESIVFELEQLKKDGTAFWTEIIAKILLDNNNKPVGIIGVTRDITYRKLTEDTLRKNQNKINSIFRAAPIGIGVTSNRILVELNDYIYRMLGYSSEELIGKSARILYPTEEEYEFVGREKYKQIERFGTGTVETKWVCKDGRIIDVLLSSTPLNLKEISGGVTFTALDITQRKQIEELIKESEANLNSMINNRFESIWSIDKYYNYIITNNFFKEAYLRTFGIELKKGMNALNILTPELKEFWKSKYDKASEGENVVFEITNLVGKELHYYEVSLDPIISDDKIIGVSGISVDITARKQAEQILKNSAAEKEALHRELLHRVKNSFNQIRALLYFEREKIQEPMANNILENLEMRVGTLSHLYSLLNESGISQQIDLGEYLGQITNSLKQSFVENENKLIVKIDFDKITTSPKTASSVGLIVNEILTNSFKYAFPGNKKGKISVSLKTNDRNAEIEISDNGIGLPQNFNVEKSSGMGLQLVKMLIQQINGKMTVNIKKGTKFKFIFPLDE
jgi:PAS domain S-box-containing protein